MHRLNPIRIIGADLSALDKHVHGSSEHRKLIHVESVISALTDKIILFTFFPPKYETVGRLVAHQKPGMRDVSA